MCAASGETSGFKLLINGGRGQLANGSRRLSPKLVVIMTEQVYFSDSYLFESRGKVVRVEPVEIPAGGEAKDDQVSIYYP